MVCLLWSGMVFGQTTGSFNTNINYNGQQRQLAMYVPTNYNAANKYKLMICLHGLGDDPANYRSYLMNNLGWNTAFPNTIFVCPAPANANTDFFEPAGGQYIIDSSIAYAMNTYHIDTTDVVLQGFSLGGRAALCYGLDHPAVFKGLLLNTPAVQGVKEAINGGAYTYNYSNAANLKIYMTHGGTDVLYTAAIDTTLEKLIVNNSKVKLVRLPALGHVVPPVSQMGNFEAHLSDPGNAPYDLDLVKLTVPQRTCSPQVTPVCLIRNTGKNTLTSARIHYVSGAVSGDYVWTGTLAPFGHASVTLPVINATIGTQNITLSVTQLNGSLTDTVTVNNTASGNVTYAALSKALPFSEGFEGNTFPPADWVLESSGELYSELYRDDEVFKTGVASFGGFNTLLIFDNLNRHEDIVSPLLDLTSTTGPKVSFDVAYNYHRFTPPYFTQNVDLADTLEVLISTDCGATYQSLYKKGGSQLATFATPIINPINIVECFATPADSNWRRETIDLQAYASNNAAQIKFRYISALGGSLNIDNVSFSNSSVSVPGVAKSNLRIFPNPASDLITIVSGTDDIRRLELLDVSGKLLRVSDRVIKAGDRMDMDVSGVAAGVYFIRVQSAGGVKTERLVIAK